LIRYSVMWWNMTYCLKM